MLRVVHQCCAQAGHFALDTEVLQSSVIGLSGAEQSLSFHFTSPKRSSTDGWTVTRSATEVVAETECIKVSTFIGLISVSLRFVYTDVPLLCMVVWRAPLASFMNRNIETYHQPVDSVS